MLLFGSPIVEWSAIGKVVIAGLVGGCGIVIVFGFLLLGLKFAGVGDPGETHTERSKMTGYTLAALCGIIVIGVIVLGIYAIIQKPSCRSGPPRRLNALEQHSRSLALSLSRGGQRRLAETHAESWLRWSC